MPLLLLMLVAGCFSRCPLADEVIGDVSDDLDATIARIVEGTANVSPFEAYSEDLVVGECANGPSFIFRSIGPFTWQYDYFERQATNSSV